MLTDAEADDFSARDRCGRGARWVCFLVAVVALGGIGIVVRASKGCAGVFLCWLVLFVDRCKRVVVAVVCAKKERHTNHIIKMCLRICLGLYRNVPADRLSAHKV